MSYSYVNESRGQVKLALIKICVGKDLRVYAGKIAAACFHALGSNFYFCLASKRGLFRFVDGNFDLNNSDPKGASIRQLFDARGFKLRPE